MGRFMYMFEFCGKQSFEVRALLHQLNKYVLCFVERESVKALLGEKDPCVETDNSTRQGHEASDPEHLGSCSSEILVGQKDGFMEGLRLDGLFIQNE